MNGRFQKLHFHLPPNQKRLEVNGFQRFPCAADMCDFLESLLLDTTVVSRSVLKYISGFGDLERTELDLSLEFRNKAPVNGIMMRRLSYGRRDRGSSGRRNKTTSRRNSTLSPFSTTC